MAADEATCLRLAAECGLPVPEAELLDIAELPVLAVRRYDRQDAPAGDIPVRVHQEDGGQATATPPWLLHTARAHTSRSAGGLAGPPQNPLPAGVPSRSSLRDCGKPCQSPG